MTDTSPPRPVPRPGIDRIKAHMLATPAPPPEGHALILNSNESTYGPSPRAVAAATEALSRIERYFEAPDAVLAPAIAARFGLRADWIVTGAGSDALLARVARAYLGPGTELIRNANGYLRVPNYVHPCGADVVSVADDDFVTSVDRMLAAVTDRTRIVFLANPENPTGTHLPDAEVRRLHAGLPGHVILILDCAYEEYVDAPGHAPPHLLVEEAENVVMARTFSKVFGLAGARVGWIYAPPAIADVVRKIGPTFPLAAPSAAAALAALEDREHTDMVRTETVAERARMTRRLTDLGLEVVPSQTNFILIRFPDPARGAAAAHDWLVRRGIVLRRVAAPAFADYIRASLGRPRENDAVVAAIAGFLGRE